MKKSIKSIAVALALITCFGANAMTASAETTRERTVYASQNMFNHEWETKIIYKLNSSGVTIGELVYGFNTTSIDEDYAWAKGYECDAKAGIKRINVDGDFKDSIFVDEGNYSKKEIQHKSNEVKYKIVFRSTYDSNDIGEKSYDSNVKN